MDKSVPISKTEVATIQSKAAKLLEKDTQAYKAGKLNHSPGGTHHLFTSYKQLPPKYNL